MRHILGRHRKSARRRATAGVLTALVLAAAPSGARAVTINATFLDEGETFTILDAGEAGPAGSPVGGGNLMDIFDAAAERWELAIRDDRTFDIEVGWQELPETTITASNKSLDGDEGIIIFNNTRPSPTDVFADPTPRESEEYATAIEASEDLGGGEVNTGRVFADATGDAALRFDLLTFALHAIGHVLGIVDQGDPAFDGTDPEIVVGSGLPFPGTRIDTDPALGGHLEQAEHPNALMVVPLVAGERRLPSDIDILGAAELNNFNDVDVQQVPGPLPLVLLAGGCCCLAVLGYRRDPDRA